MIGDRLKALRKERGLSLTELAERSNVAKSYLSAIERGIQDNPSIQVVEKLAAVLSVPVHEVLSDESAEENAMVLDSEWLELTREVAGSGITKEQFREWLEFQRWRRERGD